MHHTEATCYLSPMNMRIPPFLKKGSLVGITATARKVTPEELFSCRQALQRQGFRIREGRHLYATDHQYGGTDAQRAEGLQELMDDPEVEAILCARGGYGTMRILPNLDFTGIRENPKWIIGFSDITCLHAALLQEGIASIHGLMAFSFDPARSDGESRKRLMHLLKGQPDPVEYRHIPLPPARKDGKAIGRLIGGNLSLINQLSGTQWQPDSTGKILFLEDLDEYLYHLDRMMLHLKNAGWFEGLSGMVVGHFSDMKDNPVPFGRSALQIIADAVAEYQFPVAWHFPAGHEKQNYPIVIGANCSLEVEGHRVTFHQLV